MKKLSLRKAEAKRQHRWDLWAVAAESLVSKERDGLRK